MLSPIVGEGPRGSLLRWKDSGIKVCAWNIQRKALVQVDSFRAVHSADAAENEHPR